MGIALQLLASGFLATSWGWQAIFYANGTLGAIWAFTYIIFGADSPETSRFISKEEVLYIQTSLGRDGEQKVRNYLNHIYQKSIINSLAKSSSSSYVYGDNDYL